MFAVATDPSSSLELKSKLDTSNFHESSGLENESKSFGIEASVVETDDDKPAITGIIYVRSYIYSARNNSRLLAIF